MITTTTRKSLLRNATTVVAAIEKFRKRLDIIGIESKATTEDFKDAKRSIQFVREFIKEQKHKEHKHKEEI